MYVHTCVRTAPGQPHSGEGLCEGQLQTLQHSRGWGAAGAPLRTAKPPGAPGSPPPTAAVGGKARRARSLRAGRGAPGYDSFSLPTWLTLTSSLIRLNSQHPERTPAAHHRHSLKAKEQFFPSLPLPGQLTHPPAAPERAPRPRALPAESGNKKKLEGSGSSQKQLTGSCLL